MAGYDNSWIINALNAGALTRAQRDQRALQQQQQERLDSQTRWEREQALAERQADEAAKAAKVKEAERTEAARRERYYGRLFAENQGNQETLARISAGARAQGINLGASQPMQVEIAGGPAEQTNWSPADTLAPQQPSQLQAAPLGAEMAAQEAAARAPEIAMELEGRAAGILGVQKPEEAHRRQTPMTEIGKLVYDETGLLQGDPGYPEHFARVKAEVDAQKAAETRAKQSGTAADLRKEFQALPTVKNMGTIAESYERIRGAPASGVGDMALIFGLMKMQDPNSSVREGEYANAENAGGAFSKYGNLYNKVLEGAVLTDDLRAKFKSEGARFYSAQRRLYEAEAENYREYAAGLGFDPSHVVFDRFERGEAPPRDPNAVKAEANAFYQRLVSSGIEPAQAKQMTISKYRQGAK